jgi:hypothetical protein
MPEAPRSAPTARRRWGRPRSTTCRSAPTAFTNSASASAAAGLDWREFLVPGTSLWQLFVYDPSGVQLELTFNGDAEVGPPPDMSPGRRYVAGASFFAPR